MLVMQVICWRLVSSVEPIYGNSADEQNGPPMNADERRWEELPFLSAFICVYLRPNTNLPNSAQGLQKDGQYFTRSFPT
jgi:hypothetical protein